MSISTRRVTYLFTNGPCPCLMIKQGQANLIIVLFVSLYKVSKMLFFYYYGRITGSKRATYMAKGSILLDKIIQDTSCCHDRYLATRWALSIIDLFGVTSDHFNVQENFLGFIKHSCAKEHDHMITSFAQIVWLMYVHESRSLVETWRHMKSNWNQIMHIICSQINVPCQVIKEGKAIE